jgi:Mg2+-importing ATPase
VTTVASVVIGLALPWSPLAPVLGLVPLPPAYFLFLGPATLTYLALVEIVKRPLMRHLAD